MRVYSRDGVEIHQGDFRRAARSWPSPVAIISDGAYGVSKFPGDPPSPRQLLPWYQPHVDLWTRAATPETTLWFWNTEIGWATVHPLLEDAGWRYRASNTWNKGLGHIAGNSNTGTLRRFPQVTEVCVQYDREPVLELSDAGQSVQEWLRSEWRRTGLPLHEANRACGVRDAASRKYLAADAAWYMPPEEMLERLADHANLHGDPAGRPYFRWEGEGSPDPGPGSRSRSPVLRAKFRCPPGVTNVWDETHVAGPERLRSGGRTLHANQKPLSLMKRLIVASTGPGDMVWEPFGGLCTAAVAALAAGRRCRSAETDPETAAAAVRRLDRFSRRAGM